MTIVSQIFKALLVKWKINVYIKKIYICDIYKNLWKVSKINFIFNKILWEWVKKKIEQK